MSCDQLNLSAIPFLTPQQVRALTAWKTRYTIETIYTRHDLPKPTSREIARLLFGRYLVTHDYISDGKRTP